MRAAEDQPPALGEFCLPSGEPAPAERHEVCATSDAAWRRAAADPKLCPGTVEHGAASLRALRQALRACCGCWCVFHGTALPAPPSTALGWSLDAPRGCWRETDSSEECARNFWAGRPATRPVGVECDGPQPPPPAPCDLLLSPVEHPPVGFCGPQLLIAGSMKCGTNLLANILAQHEESVLKVAQHRWVPHAAFGRVSLPDESTGQCGYPVDSVVGGARGAACRAEGLCASGCGDFLIYENHYFSFATGSNGSDSGSLANRRRYAAMLANTAGSGGRFTFDKSPSYFQGQFYPDLPARARALLPRAKVVVAVCDPTSRLWSQYNHELRMANETEKHTAVTAYLAERGVDSFSQLVALFNASRAAGDERGRASARWLEQEFLERGYYGLHLLDWYTAFGRANVHVVNTDEMAGRRTAKAVRALLTFAQLPLRRFPWANLSSIVGLENTWHGYTRGGMPQVEAERLVALYAPHNELLRSLARVRVGKSRANQAAAAADEEVGEGRRDERYDAFTRRGG